MGKKQISDEVVLQFRSVIIYLYSKGYYNKDIAAKLGKKAPNLSSYVTSAKGKQPQRPGKKLTDKVKEVFEEEWKEVEGWKKSDDPKFYKVEDPQGYLSKLEEQDKISKTQDERIQHLENRVLEIEENTKKILALLEDKREGGLSSAN